ncbi:MAG: HAMP domain-containing histidine kinase [Eubacterium sp.]|nr:HAMP domain-containing histidine kinase [Eubacterium sp.]
MINKDIKGTLAFGIIITALLSVLCMFIEPICAVICLVLGVAVTSVFIYFTKKRYDKLNELNNYLSLVCAGNFDLDIADNTEGELSILKNNLYKVIVLLRSQNELLKKDKVYLADSLADISHQLKTPLTSMMVMTDLLKNEDKPDKRKEFIEIIENQLEKMKWLITNLLKLSKLDAGTVDFKYEEFSIKNILDQSIKPFLVTLDLKGISFENRAEDFTVNGDSKWTTEAFENIIKNCIEHTDKGGELIISTQITNLYSSVIIKDNGCGIAKEDLPHIFERFYHGKNSSSDSVGIGLALAKAVFERENGKITVTSEISKGTEFEIRFYKAIV